MLVIRSAQLKDLHVITEVYNEAVLATDATFDTEIKSYDEQREWFEKHESKYPIFVSELDGIIVGWVSLSKWSDRCAYTETAEISLYMKEEFRGKGIGRRLLEAIIQEGEKVGLHMVIARITEGSKISIHLHESLGFEHSGVMREVGQKFG